MGPDHKIIQDQYEILEDSGKGGMAAVSKARQLSLGRVVAIKEIKPAFASNPELVERFKREARIAASLVHENIVQVYNFGEPQPGELFIIMEYVDGNDLRTLLKLAGVIPPRISAIIGKMVAQALAYAHARGLVHRDVKPANIMVSNLGEVKLMDFGIVRERDSELTRTGAFLGTPNYMAPEQFLGEEITPAADLFSLGVVMYEILTGQKPFKADNEATLAKKVRSFRETKIRTLSPDVPRKLQAIVHQCLNKNPAKRPASASQLCRELDRFLGRAATEEFKEELAALVLDYTNFRDNKSGPGDAPIKLHDSLPVRDEPVSVDEPEIRNGPRVTEPPRSVKPPRAEVREDPDGPVDIIIPKKPRRSEPRPEPELTPPPAKSRAPKPAPTAKPAPAPAPKKAPAPRPDDYDDDDDDEDFRPGEFIIKWLWRTILLAIALLAALIVFLLYPGDREGPPGQKSLIERVIGAIRPDQPAPPP